MWKTLAAASVVLTIATPNLAQEPGFDSPECRLMAMKISETTGAFLTGVRGTQKIAYFSHPFAGPEEFSLYCEAGFVAKLTFYDKSIAPAAQWYMLISMVGEAIGLDSAKVEEQAKDCMHKAVSSSEQTARTKTDLQLFRCNAFTDPASNSLKIFSYTQAGKKLYMWDAD